MYVCCRALLQRISAVLTAPPKINDEDYVKMRKIVCTLKTHAGSYEQQILDAHTKQLFVQIKKIGPYYKPKQWELDYRRQLEGQKFMRQVTYKRPKGFVDPFAPKVTESLNDDNSSLANSLTNDKFRMRRANKSYAHINVVRNVKKTNENPNSKSAPVLSLVENNSNTGNNRVISRDEEEVYEDDEYDEDPSTKVNETDGYEAETDEMTQGFNEALLENTEKRLNLAQTVRETRIYDPSFDGEHAFELKATIECFLIDTTTALVIVAKTVDTVGAAPLVAEAEIDLRELCNLKDDLKLFNPLVGTTTPPVQERDKEGSAQDGIASTNISEMDGLFAGGNEEKQPQVMYEYDMNGLEALGRDIVSSVEIRVEDGVPRLVLNVTNNGDGEKDMRAHSNSNLVTHSNSNNDDDEKHQILTTALCRSKNASPVKGVEDEAFINNVLSEGNSH